LLINISLFSVDHIGLSDVKNDDYKSSGNQAGAREIKFLIREMGVKETEI